MMEFITDRTEADVLLGNAKGLYRYTDLNRVEQAVAELCVLATQLDLHINLPTKTDWERPGTFSADSWPTESQMERYLGNVHALCDCFSVKSAIPATVTNLTYIGANAIEKALHSAYMRVQAILQTYQYSGELYAGEENAL